MLSESPPCPYRTLGVPRDATLTQIKSAYRKLALRHHPDKQRTDPDRAASAEVFTRISNAYEILGDEGRRREHDLGGGGGGSGRGGGGRGRGRSGATGQPSGEGRGHGPGRGSRDRDPDRSGDPFGGGRDPIFGRSGGGGGGFSDPFEMFERVFGEEFGSSGGLGPRRGRGGRGGQAEGQQRRRGGGGGGSFFGGPFADDPFFSRGMGGGGGGGFGSMGGGFGSMGGGFGSMGGGFGGFGGFGVMDRMMSQMGMMDQAMGAHSLSADLGGFGNGRSESVSTTTQIINGRRRTVTERTVVRPDGTVERHVETAGDEDFPTRAIDDGRGKKRGRGFIEMDHASGRRR